MTVWSGIRIAKDTYHIRLVYIEMDGQTLTATNRTDGLTARKETLGANGGA